MFLLSPDQFLVKTTKKKGRGAFLKKDIPAGTVIGDYLGRVMRDKTAERLEEEAGGKYYAMDYYGDDVSIFPDVESVGVHLINHSCAPNCDTYHHYGHTLYFALRHVFAGEELTMDYAFDPDSDADGSSACCFCGSAVCRGTMNTSHGRIDSWSSFYKQQVKGQRFKRLKAGQKIPALEKYPEKIAYHSYYNVFANPEARPENRADNSLPPLSELHRRLRAGGRPLRFSRLGLTIWAVMDGQIVARK